MKQPSDRALPALTETAGHKERDDKSMARFFKMTFDWVYCEYLCFDSALGFLALHQANTRVH